MEERRLRELEGFAHIHMHMHIDTQTEIGTDTQAGRQAGRQAHREGRKECSLHLFRNRMCNLSKSSFEFFIS